MKKVILINRICKGFFRVYVVLKNLYWVMFKYIGKIKKDIGILNCKDIYVIGN